LNLAEIRDAAIEAPTFFQTSGKAGRLNFSVRHGEKIKCEFDNATEMNEAIHLLAPLLSSTLKVNVEWNGEKRQFGKEENDLTRRFQAAIVTTLIASESVLNALPVVPRGGWV